MNYSFPQIDDINDVLPHIQGRDEFIVAVKDGGYTVVNYVVQMDGTFGDPSDPGEAIRRECRGLIFDTQTGGLLHRRPQKFFNAGERDETQPGRIDLSQPHVILEKLDGSLITPVMTHQGLRWGTKMGVTDVALPVERFVAEHPEYAAFVERWGPTSGYTPCFEWCSRQQRIVVDYPTEQLVLIAIRHNQLGHYIQYTPMVNEANQFGIPVVQAYKGSVQSMEHLLEHTRDLVGAEGYVIRFDDGHMVKIKGLWYLQLHRAKDAISREKNVIQLLASGTLDDIRAALSDTDLARIESYEHEFWQGFRKTFHDINSLYQKGMAQVGDDRRAYAVDFVNHQPEHLRPFLFGMRKGQDLQELLLDAIIKGCASQSRVDQVRWIFRAHWIDSTQPQE
jgi:RNA ligase